MKTSDKLSAYIIADFLKSMYIEDIIICPGSRNIPLINALKAEKSFHLHSIINEHQAGFIALGIYKASHKPVAVVTTSGSAVLQLSSALSEAYYDRIPLIAITADRPTYLLDKGENQTINQVEIYENFISHSIDIPEDDEQNSIYEKLSGLRDYLYNPSERGPIHINVHFDKPLNNLVDRESYRDEFNYNIVNESVANPKLNECLSNSKETILYITDGINKELQAKLETLISKHNAVIVTEPTCGLEVKNSILNFDKISNTINKELIPELVITYGNSFISNELRNRFKDTNTLHIDIAPYERDWLSFGQEKNFFQLSLAHLLQSIEQNSQNSDEFFNTWKREDQKYKSEYSYYIEDKRQDDFHAIDLIRQHIPTDSSIFWGNSTIIRYATWLNTEDITCYNYANRGVSGIDGVLATAIGYSMKSKKKTICIIGDVALSYELASLQLLSKVKDFKLIVIKNGGGDIFNQIHSLDKSDSSLITTPIEFNLTKIVKNADIQHYISNDIYKDEKQISDLLKSIDNSILEIQTSPTGHWCGYWSK